MPSGAHPLVAAAAAQTLDRMALALGELITGLTQGLDLNSLHRIHDGIGLALVQLNVLGADAEDERSTHLAVAPDTGPLLRTLLRLHHDLVMLGRAAIVPLPEAFASRLGSPLAHAKVAISDYLRASAAALQQRRGPPALNSVESTLATYAAEIVALRREGLTRTLPGDVAECFFALGFALEQMHNNLKDLQRCVAEWDESPKEARRDSSRST